MNLRVVTVDTKEVTRKLLCGLWILICPQTSRFTSVQWSVPERDKRFVVNIDTTRFGAVEIEKEDILQFEAGLIGFCDSKDWVILADAENPAVAWIQSLQDCSLALAVVSPRRFIPNYQVRLTVSELSPIHLTDVDQAFVLCVVSRNDNRLTMNLRAPVIINLDQKIGAQIMTSDDQPLQYPFANLSSNLRQSA